MSPGPLARHQRIQGDLLSALIQRFRKHPCQVFGAPLDVRLSEEDVVQPDVLIVCDPKQIQSTHIEGPPRLAVEILSDSSLLHDRVRKSRLYARSVVAEYWIVTPFPSIVEVFTLEAGGYRLSGAFEKSEALVSPAFPDLALPLEDVFMFSLEPGEEPPAVREPRPRHAERKTS